MFLKISNFNWFQTVKFEGEFPLKSEVSARKLIRIFKAIHYEVGFL